MSTLAMVRHGQASFFAENYDQLSPLGEQQARLLGEYWLRRGVRLNEIYTGPRLRQRETASLAGEAFLRAGLPWPEPQVLEELDEHQVDRLIKVAMPEITREYPEIGKLHGDYLVANTPRDKHRTFQIMFEKLVMLWVAGRVQAPGVESWQAFQRRVRAGIGKIVAGDGRGRAVAAFTSVGAVTATLHLSLDCSDRTAFDLGWRLRNASITDFLFSRERLTLEGFNAFPHLDDPEMWTYR